MGNETGNKILKVNSEVVKVNVGMVKPQITFIKRNVNKFLKENELAAAGNTATKPEAVKLSEDQSKKVQGIIKAGYKAIEEKYPHTTKPQMTYIKNHFATHSTKYLK